MLLGVDPWSTVGASKCRMHIRTAELVIELFDTKPFRVCRETFSIFQFDSQGCLDIGRYDKQQNALVNVMLDPVFASKTPDANVLDATAKFVAKGGSWSPTNEIADISD